MPELPEVETVVRDLRPRLLRRRLASVETGGKRLRRPWSAEWANQLAGRRVRDVRRRGKWIVVELAGGAALVFHLGMTGRLTVVASETAREPHTHLVFGLDRGRQQLRFRDVRRFGCATFYTDPAALERSFRHAGLGPEPFDLRAGVWHAGLTATRRCLKAVLLDQRVVAGVGNIYADESLFEARLPPTQPGCRTTPAEAERLRRGVIRVLRRAIDKRGSSIRDYVGGSGERGSYQDEFRVYGRAGKPCPRCGAPIACIRLAGRSTHYCPKCQGSGVRNQGAEAGT